MSQAAQDLSAVVTRLDGRIEPGAATLSTAASTERPAAQIIELPVVAGPDEAPAKIEVAVVDAPRAEERRGGKACVGTGRYGGGAPPLKKKEYKNRNTRR